MIPIYLDPALLALPNGLAENSDELATLVDRVVELSSWARECCAFTLIKPHGLEEALESCGAFPSFSIIRETLEFGELSDIFTAKDVLLSLLTIIERAHSAVDVYGVDVSKSSLIDPELVSTFNRFPIDVRAMSINALASVCLLKSTGKLKGDGFAVSGHPDLHRQTLTFEGAVEELKTADKIDLITPINVTGSIHVLSSPQDVLDMGGAIKLWHAAENATDIHAAIETRVREFVSADASLARPDVVFSIGSDFLDSLRDNQAFGDGNFGSTVLDACARIAAGMPKYEVSDFGERSLDSAQGKRTHATKHRPALRLLFWVHTDGEIEFANIGQKNDLEIQAGEPARRSYVVYPG